MFTNFKIKKLVGSTLNFNLNLEIKIQTNGIFCHKIQHLETKATQTFTQYFWPSPSHVM